MSTMTANGPGYPYRRAPMFSRIESIVAWLPGGGLVVSLTILLLWKYVVLAIPPGHVGVRYSLLGGGTVLDEVLPEGIAVKLPWDRIYIFEVRTRRHPYNVYALTAEGMGAVVEGSVLFRPITRTVPELLITLGQNYDERVVMPLTISSTRKIIGKYNSNELYSIDHEDLQEQLLELIRQHPLADNILFDDLVMTRITLPDNIVRAIEDKLTREQVAASYQFRLERQKQEAERLRIQAIGVRNFYSIVSEALTDALLTWRGIEATVELAQSPNSKVVIVGGGQDQLPLILGSDIGTLPEHPTPVPSITGESHPLPDWATLPRVFTDHELDEVIPSLRGKPAPPRSPRSTTDPSSAGRRRNAASANRRPYRSRAPKQIRTWFPAPRRRDPAQMRRTS